MRLVADDASEFELRDAVRDHGGDPDVLDQFAGLLVPLTGRGQLGATRRKSRVGPELSWLDGPRGRVRVRTANGWTSVNSLRRNEFRAALSELATMARARGPVGLAAE